MTVGRDYTGETPCGMKFTTLAGVMGGGASSPGLWAIPSSISPRRKFIKGDGGLETGASWSGCPRSLKEELKERLINARGKELGYPNLYDMIADETVGITEEEICPSCRKKGHPALSMAVYWSVDE
jgi:acetyl-CoA synthase